MTYLEAIADRIRAQVPRDHLPAEDTTDLFIAYAVLALAKGEAVTGEDVHNAWVAWMLGRGQEHEAMVPFADLPVDTRAQDSPFVVAIRQVAQLG